MSDLPACKDCSYYYEELDLPFCKRYAFEKPDYIDGKMYKVGRLAHLARESEDLCGFNARGFELSEVEPEPEPESRPSLLSRIFRRNSHA